MLVVSDVYTLPDLLARAVNEHPDSDIVVFPNSRTTFTELYERASKAARSLKAIGIKPRRFCWDTDVKLH
ncbi:MAG: hypothetical protein Ct9H90mP5_02740 [Acidimicrobiaceae bacterium]|nr:MAG: hypothetical protein Ct9H90mP5_02740 [Acidimicrobiaceae bacterium]